jgi:hypothetical protein
MVAPDGLAVDEHTPAAVTTEVAERDRRVSLKLARGHPFIISQVKNPATLIALLLLALPLDVLWLLSIESHQFVTCFAMDPEQLIEFRMDSLGVAMLGSLDQERHEPGRQGSDCVPIERLSLE